jgi:hypothetical protein
VRISEGERGQNITGEAKFQYTLGTLRLATSLRRSLACGKRPPGDVAPLGGPRSHVFR